MDAKKLEALQAEHGDVRVIELVNDDAKVFEVVLRKPRASASDPKADEFYAFWTKRTALEQAPAGVEDPTDDGTSETLRCLIEPDQITVKRHLNDFPMDAQLLFGAMTEMAGAPAIADAPELITEEVRAKVHKRAIGLRAGAHTVIARPMSRAEFAHFQKKNGGKILPMRAAALYWLAWSCADELPDAEKRKPRFEAAVQDVPYLAILLGMSLIGLASSQGADRMGKSQRPPSPQ